MQSVILAAGRGTRLHPFTAHRSKAMMPIVGKPIVERVMQMIAASGTDKFILVVSRDDLDIRRYFEHESEFRGCVTLVEQPERQGTADALSCAAHLLRGDFILSACDNLQVPGKDLQKMLTAWKDESKPDGVLSLLQTSKETISKSGAVVLDGCQVTRALGGVVIASDLVRKRVLFATEGQDHQVWLDFVTALEKHNGHRHAVRQVSMDMRPAYRKGVAETCRNAQVVFDKFHVIAHANQAVDEVRRADVRLGGAGVREALRQSQWLWRKNPENLTENEAARLAKIDQKSLRTAKAYQMRLVLQDIYRSVSATEARRRFRVWCRWVRWVARQQPKNLLRSMVKVATMVENHLAGILAHWKWGVTNAFMEGLNSVFSATKRKARGYRSTTHLITMLYFVAGKLRFPQF